MLFKELLSSINKWEIVAEMRNEGFAQIYDRLMEMEPAEKSRTILMVVDQWDDVADEAYVDVMGYSVEDDEYYALEFMDWNEWLGFEVAEMSLRQFGILKFVCYCLEEMTFLGMEENSAKETRDRLEKTVVEVTGEIGKEYNAWRRDKMLGEIEKG